MDFEESCDNNEKIVFLNRPFMICV